MTFGLVHLMKMVILVQKPVRITINILVLLVKKWMNLLLGSMTILLILIIQFLLALPTWPGNGIDGDYQFLAPYYDANDDGEYNPNDGDYPKYDIDGDLDCNEDDLIYGDQTLYWVFNDKGNIHSETSADPIGLEIRAQAFAFATNDEINNMTFYNYKIINKATIQLNDAYFGQWVDPDLGKYDDDYVGCDVARGFGYCYNGDDNDEGASGYGTTPPAIGVDFFQGPLADPDDGIDNDRDSIIDEPGEQAIMSRFVYYNNDFTVTGNPENGQHVYNYLLVNGKMDWILLMVVQVVVVLHLLNLCSRVIQTLMDGVQTD